MTPLLDAALRYAERCWPIVAVHNPAPHVVPPNWAIPPPPGVWCSCRDLSCTSPAKHPRTPDLFHQATTEEATIRTWWERWPDANVGVCSGQQSGLVVLDVDGEPGRESFARLEAEFGPFAPTPKVVTARGFHLYFADEGRGVPNSVGRLGRGLDVRGTGGIALAVAPPSVHVTGVRYSWDPNADEATPIAPWPF